MSDTFAIGIVGTGVVAEQIAASLIERAFPVSSLRFLVAAEALGDTVEVEERAFPIESLEDVTGNLDLVFLTTETDWRERDIDSLVLSGAMLIDLSGRYAREPDVPLLVPECNSDLADTATDRRIVASPDAVAIALCVVLSPLRAEAGLRRVVATCLEPVSEAGTAGIQELSRQSVDLLQGRSPEAEVFPVRVAFNILPRLGDIAPSGDSGAEERAVWQVRRVLDDPDLPVSITRICTPHFFGTGIALNVEFLTPLDAADAASLLRSSPGILATLPEEEDNLGLAAAVGQDATLVSRVRGDRSGADTLNLWVALDNTRKGSAVNAVQIAESLFLNPSR